MIVNSISIPKSKIKPKEILIEFQITDFIIVRFLVLVTTMVTK